MEKEIERRKSLAWNKFWSLKPILKGNYAANLKCGVFNARFYQLYGAQTWSFNYKTRGETESDAKENGKNHSKRWIEG